MYNNLHKVLFLVLHSLTEYNFITYYYHNNAYPYHPYRSDDVFNDFRADGKEVKGANSTFGEINKVIKSIYYSKESDDIKKQNLTSFKNYIKAVNSKRVLDIKTETFKLIYNIIFLLC